MSGPISYHIMNTFLFVPAIKQKKFDSFAPSNLDSLKPII